MEYFKRGSEWRKWDLHLHTPSSFDYRGNPTNEEIIQTLKDNEISAAVITDHHRIDVERIMELANLGKKENILILPGIELRSELGGRELIHFIGIFPLENIDHIWDRIKGELRLTDHDIQTKGNDNIICPIEKSCEIFHELGGITTIHAGEKSNSIEILTKYVIKHEQKKELLKNFIDILEIGSEEEDINRYNEIVFPQIGFKIPLIMGSDYHNVNDYNIKQNCWIKADLTFEGLKQIIYEPEERVKIQEVCPDEKSGYAVIESVQFEDDEFINSEIFLNSNLVSIIGGRSTGKSIFLRSIAKAIDKHHVEEVCGDISELINPNTIVKWKNDEVDTIEDSSGNKIRYIPQNFLTNKIETEPDSYSNKLITDILKSDDNYKDIFSNITNHITMYETDIQIKISKLFDTEIKLIDLKKEQKELGSPEAIKEQIKVLTKKYDDLQDKVEISEEDITLQKKLMDELRDLNKKLDSFGKDNKFLNDFSDYLKLKNTFLDDKSFIQNLSTEIKNEINLAINEADTNYKNSLVTFVEGKIDANNKTIEEIQRAINSNDEKLEPLNAIINSSDQAKDIFDKINDEKRTLSLIEDNMKIISETEEDYEHILNEIFVIYASLIENLKEEKERFLFDSEKYNSFKTELIFKTKKFQKTLTGLLNNQKFPAFKREKGINLSDFKYIEANFQKEIEEIIKAILKDFLIPKKGPTKKDVIKELLNVNHFINFNIFEDGDKLENMSPGKKSFALLKVLIESDKSRWPILIDQPEDDLDANSISKHLSKFFKEKKKYRQIIIVSHNPNLVVGADSEQVIIANQEGSDSKNKDKRFEYISGSIENTYTDEDESCYLYCRGIKEHICDILEGGKESFKKRQYKYNIE